jgi:ankyrin repeat protein
MSEGNNKGNKQKKSKGENDSAENVKPEREMDIKNMMVFTSLVQDKMLNSKSLSSLLQAFRGLSKNSQMMSAGKYVKGKLGRIRLMHAALMGDVPRLQELISFGENVNSEDDNGFTALTWAAFAGRIEAVRALLDNGAEINGRAMNKTPLLFAIRGNNFPLVRLLCDRGADIDGDRNIEEACRNNISPEILEFLCQHHPNLAIIGDHGTPLHKVAYSLATGADKARILVRYGAPLEAVFTQQTPLLWAADARNVAVVRALCELGANKEAREGSGLTPLMVACKAKMIDGTVRVLCESGADKEATDSEGKTAIFYALEPPNIQDAETVLRELLENNVNILAHFEGKSVLHTVVELQNPILVSLLCQHAIAKHIKLNTKTVIDSVKKYIAENKDSLEHAYDENNRRGPFGNENENYYSDLAKAGMGLRELTIENLNQILKTLQMYEQEIKTPTATSEDWRRGGGGSSSSKRKTRKQGNRKKRKSRSRK